MNLDDLDATRSRLNVLRGELATQDSANFFDALADLADAVAVLGRPGLSLSEFPINGAARTIPEILNELLTHRGVLEVVILTSPHLHGVAGVALHDVNRAIAGIHIMLARLKLRSAA